MKKAYKVFKEQREFIDDLDNLDPEIIPDLFNIYDKLEIEELMALAALVKTDSWMEDPVLFEDLVLIFNGISPSPLEFEGSSVNQIWYSLFLMRKFRPDLDLGELVKGYIDFIHSEEGFYVYPNEAQIKSKIIPILPQILEKINKPGQFDEFEFTDNQASKLTEAINYIQLKIKEDGIY